jgi:hypothetical protein
MPWAVEEGRNSDGSDTPDGARNAAQRWIARVRQEPPQLPLIIGGDDLYGHEPFIAQWRELRLPHVVVGKPLSHLALYAWVEALERLGGGEPGQWQEGPAGRRRFFPSRIVRSVPLTAARRLWGTLVAVWEHDRCGQQQYHPTWVTALEVPADNVAALGRIGRSRWKLENEQCKVPKNHGDEREHHYGHGPQTLSMVLYLLNLLAFSAHMILERGDRWYPRCLPTTSRRELWHTLRTALHLMLVSTWADFLLLYVDEAGSSP